VRPTVRFLSNELIEKIVAEARSLLKTLGVEIHNERAVSLLADHGAAPISKEGLAVLGTVSIPDSPCLGCPG